MSEYLHQSKYCYPGTDVLINKLDIRDPSLLRDMELALTSVRLHQLYERPIAGNFDLKHMQQIHSIYSRYLSFWRIYTVRRFKFC